MPPHLLARAEARLAAAGKNGGVLGHYYERFFRTLLGCPREGGWGAAAGAGGGFAAGAGATTIASAARGDVDGAAGAGQQQHHRRRQRLV